MSLIDKCLEVMSGDKYFGGLLLKSVMEGFKSSCVELNEESEKEVSVVKSEVGYFLVSLLGEPQFKICAISGTVEGL